MKVIDRRDKRKQVVLSNIRFCRTNRGQGQLCNRYETSYKVGDMVLGGGLLVDGIHYTEDSEALDVFTSKQFSRNLLWLETCIQ